MRAQIIQIGNSQGLRLPKMLLEERQISGEVELEIHPDGILIRNAKLPRAGWDEAFKAAADSDDEVESATTKTDFDKREWQW